MLPTATGSCPLGYFGSITASGWQSTLQTVLVDSHRGALCHTRLLPLHLNNIDYYYHNFDFYRRRFGQSKNYFASRKSKCHSVWQWEMWNSCTSFLPNTCAWAHSGKNEITQRNRGRMWEDMSEYKVRSTTDTKKKKSRRPNCCSGLPSPRDRSSPKQCMNYLTNLTYTYNNFIHYSPRQRTLRLSIFTNNKKRQ